MPGKRILSGYRPTGKLHLGHLHGNLSKMIELQQEAECYFFVADWHALTTDYQDTQALRANTEDMVLDWLAAGIDPARTVIYRQSDLPQVAELALYLSFITPLGWLERVPTYKEQLEQLGHKEISTHGFLGYPVLQAADILIALADGVPVGEDQLPHLELTREIARRFNFLYGELLPEPASILSSYTRVPGTDGRKMSKSYDNFIGLAEEPDSIRSKLKKMVTDPARVRRVDPGDPDKCPVYSLHKIYTPDRLEEVAQHCRDAYWGCIECKDLLADRIVEALAPLRARRAELEEIPGLAWKVLSDGLAKIEPLARDTLRAVRRAIAIDA
ncbi:MAG: tryptophan--tRNA ligase [Candidatus Geothermincolia bacterium]